MPLPHKPSRRHIDEMERTRIRAAWTDGLPMLAITQRFALPIHRIQEVVADLPRAKTKRALRNEPHLARLP